mgnify:CR=1 FL=1
MVWFRHGFGQKRGNYQPLGHASCGNTAKHKYARCRAAAYRGSIHKFFAAIRPLLSLARCAADTSPLGKCWHKGGNTRLEEPLLLPTAATLGREDWHGG